MAAQSKGLEFDDTRQTIWLKFVRYPPQTISAAWTMARHARNSLWRRERKRLHADVDALRAEETPRYRIDNQVEAREALRTMDRKKLRWLLRYIEERNHLKRDVVRAYRIRTALRLKYMTEGAR